MTRLQEHPFIRSLDETFGERLSARANECTIAAGTFLWHQGDLSNRVYFICSGIVAVGISLPKNDSFQIEIVGAGEVLGCSSLVANHRWNFDARAITEVHAFSIEGDVMQDLCDRDGNLGYVLVRGFLQIATSRLDAARLRILDLYQPQPRVVQTIGKRPSNGA